MKTGPKTLDLMRNHNISPFNRAFDNNVNPFIPELWANESLAILEENMVMGQLVHRDFEPVIANFGDVVNTRRPGEFTAKRKGGTDSVTVQDATATNVQVPLNQWIHTSFLIHDGEDSESFKDLVDVYMAPAMLAQARIIDRILLGQVPQFLKNEYGGLGLLTSATALQYILGTRNILNVNKAYVDNRNFILTPNSETQLLNLQLFLIALDVGDGGTAMEQARLGRKLGFDMYMCQNASSVPTGNTVVTGAINHGGGYAAGAVTLVVNGFTGDVVPAGSYITIAGDNTPLKVLSSSLGTGNTTGIVLVAPGLKGAVLNSAVITVYTPGAVNLVAGYVAGWTKEILVKSFTVAPSIGQMVDIAGVKYTVIDVTSTTGITLDRPLDAAIANNDPVNIGPAGDYNFAFHRNAMALVVRPLAMPRPGTGALSAVVNYNGLSMRATITYNGTLQGHLVTLDMLCGTAVLDTNLGAVMLG